MPQIPGIPEQITVHLGTPDAAAENVTLPFLEYIANVASSEVYPTWPENALRANIYAQTSFALNRIYTQYYRSRGYDFDITNSTAFDQSFVNGRVVFENVRELVGELFGSYIRRAGNVEPLFAQYCDGVEVQCNGLSQWGSVELAEDGYTPYRILTYYYGDNIELVEDAPLGGNQLRAPAVPLRLGSTGDPVRVAQIRLNRISANYPSIPKILAADGIFGEDTEAAVRRFQEIFSLTPDGIIGPATWYRIQTIYAAVKRLNELDSEGIRLEEVTLQYPSLLQEGSRGDGVRALQFFLNYLSGYYDTIPAVAVDGIYGPSTREAVLAAQRTFGLPPDGVVGEITWNAVYDAYLGIINTVPREFSEGVALPYGGRTLRIGADSEDVLALQEYLNYIARTYPEIPTVETTGYFGPRTRESVLAYQALFGLDATGVVGPLTWASITDLYDTLYRGGMLRPGQYPGFPLGT